jgi:hypothetical protein
VSDWIEASLPVPLKGIAYGVAFAVQQRRQHAAGGALRTRLLLLDARDPRRLDAIDFLLVEARLAHHVGEQVERRVQLFLQRGHVRGGAVERGGRTEVRTQRFGAVAERERVHAIGAFVEHAHGEARGAQLVPEVGRVAATEHVAHLHHRDVVALGQDHLGAVAQRRALQRRPLQRRELVGDRHALAAVDIGGDGLVLRIGLRDHERRGLARGFFRNLHALARIDDEHVVALRQPILAGLLDVGDRSGLDRLQAVAEAARVAGVDRAFGECVGLAAEAADAFDAAHEAGLEHGARLVELGRGRALRDEALELLVDRRFHLLLVHALLHVGAHDEVRAQLRAVHGGRHVVDELVVEQQALVQARGLAAAQHLREQLQAIQVRRAVFGDVPDAVDARLRHLVFHGGTRALRAPGRSRSSAAPSSGPPGCRRRIR